MEALEFDREKKRLQTTIDVITRQMKEWQSVVQERQSHVMDIRRHFWDDITLNVDSAADLLETAGAITQHALALKSHERSHALAVQSLRKLEKQLPSPYFGRVDFTEDGKANSEAFYIGILSLIDGMTEEPLIYDWRAPVSQLFYDNASGPAEYRTPDGAVCGDITLKRQFLIKQGQLESTFDTGMRIVDEMLQQMLGKSADDKMKTIVTTIQHEQDRIIREDDYPLLIVQGAAGSGKTSVALQRVAYLLYKYSENLNADQMLLFSPNALFNDYVSTVLPELGERNMHQTTFQEYLEHRLNTGWALEDAYDQLESLLLAKAGNDYRVKLEGIQYKASAAFVRVIERYAAALQKEGLQFRDFAAKNQILISGEQLSRRFYSKNVHLPVSRRLEKLKEWVETELDEKGIEFTRSYYRELLNYPKYIGAEPELKARSKKTMKRRFAPLKQMAEELAFIDVVGTYRQLFDRPDWFAQMSKEAGADVPEQWESIRLQTMDRLERGTITYEDGVPLLYLKELIEGIHMYPGIRHVLVDEAQDYSPFQYILLRKMFPNSRMTLLGDLNQGIYPHTSGENYDFVTDLFGRDQTKVFRLYKSYRSTQEISQFTHSILPDGEPVEAFSRSGQAPALIPASSEAELIGLIAEDIHSLQTSGARSIAIICRTAAESLRAHERLSALISTELVTKDTRTFVSGVLIIPAYLAKGLEFDAVIIHNAGADVYHRETERKLFYTACTRAMHHLHLFYTGAPTPFISVPRQGGSL